ncbi:TolC family protein [Catenovulum maritimum]|uniref:Transporter n=1 Tax=Catenovulum maritimum TaxID=1513271 RepID=A0A0J8GS65_9ALTE|nr:TolC family protein [Catenovulum maritimum]KMT65645.1 hypothetical protein XM47_08085 [Catenovulum maritimum]
MFINLYKFYSARLSSKLLLIIFVSLNSFSALSQAFSINSLNQAIQYAHQHDLWLQKSELNQAQRLAQSISKSQLDNPKLTLELMNLPLDSLSLSQEAMTQVSFGISQEFARGDSLALNQAILEISAFELEILRENRRAELTSVISQIWFDAYQSFKTIEMIQAEQYLFEQMLELAQVNYTSAAAETNQDEVLKAELDLYQLQDTLLIEQEKLDANLARLSEWLINFNPERNLTLTPNAVSHAQIEIQALAISQPNILTLALTDMALVKLIMRHPSVYRFEVKQQQSQKEVALAEQSYQPRWGLTAKYGYRADSAVHSDSDFFSIGASLDMPLFSHKKQQHQVKSAVLAGESIKTEKRLVIQQLLARLKRELKSLKHLESREKLYQKKILSQSAQQTESSLTAYTHDSGHFSKVVQRKIAQLNARIKALNVTVQKAKTIVRVNYLLTQTSRSNKAKNTKSTNEKQGTSHE